MEINMGKFNENIMKTKIIYSGVANLNQKWNYHNACDPFSRLYYVISGGGFLKYGDTTVEMSSGNVYLVPAFLRFSYWCEDKMEKLYFHISMTKTDRYDLLSTVNKVLSMPFDTDKIRSMIKLYNSDDYISFLSLKNSIWSTVTSFFKRYDLPKIPINNYSETIKNTIEYINKNAKINLSVSEISKNLYLCESTLRKHFKNEVGVTVGEYVDTVVFFKAKEMLSSKSILIGEISESLGFCDQFYFSRRFKERYGKTPSEYRKEFFI